MLCIAVATVLVGCAELDDRALTKGPSDASITREVRALLAQSPSLESPTLITVQTVHKVVYLRGLVSTPYQIEEAGSIAQRAAGALHVENLLSIDNAR